MLRLNLQILRKGGFRLSGRSEIVLRDRCVVGKKWDLWVEPATVQEVVEEAGMSGFQLLISLKGA
jgi:hypothetical protein